MRTAAEQEKLEAFIAEVKKKRRAERNVIVKRYRKNNPWHLEGHKNCTAIWRKNNPEKYKEQHLRRTYGITVSDFNLLFERQGSVCATCGSSDPGRTTWHVDHCHITGKIRGILCGHCNMALGLAKDNPNTLRKMACYLESNS